MPIIDHTHSIVELNNVSFGYTDELVVKDVSLKIHTGDYLGIIGPNGGGKSTLLKLMLGLLTPRKGSITLFGTPLTKFKDWYKIGYVPQRNIFDSSFPVTVEEVVTMGTYPKRGFFHVTTKEDRQAVKKALDQVEMWEYRKRQIGDLSGGQQQRIFIARALVSQPEIIFLDEPTVGVDAKTQKEFYNLLRSLNQTMNLTLVLVSHELDVVAHESTELTYINRTIDYYGEPTKFLKGDYFHELIGKGGLHH
jgi:zinc transport system ATP-binding protein